MFGDRDSFKEHVQERIGKELLSFGLQVFNGNIAEMRDSEGNAYFSSLKQKAISGATNDARVQVRIPRHTHDCAGRIECCRAPCSLRVRRVRGRGGCGAQVAQAVKVSDIGECESQAEARVRRCQTSLSLPLCSLMMKWWDMCGDVWRRWVL